MFLIEPLKNCQLRFYSHYKIKQNKTINKVIKKKNLKLVHYPKDIILY